MALSFSTALLIFGLVGMSAVLAAVDFKLTDCAAQKSSAMVTFPSASINPYPVRVPGELRVSGSMRVRRPMAGSLKLQVSVERKVTFLWLPVPCIGQVGSCTYDDVCGLLDLIFGTSRGTPCPQQMQVCSCPVPVGTYTMNQAVFQIPKLTGLWSWLAAGDYRVTGKLLNAQTGQEEACQKLEFTLVDAQPACTGFLCGIFG